jgi:hypothetical protein
MTAAIATQRCHELHGSAQQARRAKQATETHGVRVVHRAPVAEKAPTAWARIASAFGKTTSVTPAPKAKLA